MLKVQRTNAEVRLTCMRIEGICKEENNCENDQFFSIGRLLVLCVFTCQMITCHALVYKDGNVLISVHRTTRR